MAALILACTVDRGVEGTGGAYERGQDTSWRIPDEEPERQEPDPEAEVTFFNPYTATAWGYGYESSSGGFGIGTTSIEAGEYGTIEFEEGYFQVCVAFDDGMCSFMPGIVVTLEDPPSVTIPLPEYEWDDDEWWCDMPNGPY